MDQTNFSLVEYAATDYQNTLKSYGVVQSMNRKGNPYDNACMESFFSTSKKDVVHGKKIKTITEAKLEIVDYIETFYNCKRLHSTI